MTAYDWLAVLGGAILLGIVLIGFWKSYRVKPEEQVDQFYTPSGGPPEDP